MPAEIANIAGDNMMAYLGETPWHRLGTPMTGAPNVADALKAARLDWTVSLREVYLAGGKPIAAKRAIVRDTDDVPYAVVSPDYKIIQNSEAFGVLTEACDEFGLVIETAGALGKGDRVWMSARMPDAVEPVKGDRVEGRILITAGHNGWLAHEARLTTVRTVCANTFRAATKGSPAFFKIKHAGDGHQERIDEMSVIVTTFVAALKEAGDDMAKLAAKKMTFEELDAYITAVFRLADTDTPQAEAKRRAIVELTEHGRGAEFAPGTAWAAFNAITEYTDHGVLANIKAPARLRAANVSALFGANSKLKDRAFKFALAA